jgi:hypothetical protein
MMGISAAFAEENRQSRKAKLGPQLNVFLLILYTAS